MKKIIISLAMIGAVGAIVVGATTAFFSDTETSMGNTFTAGTIDISVDGQNPWNESWSNYLDKPCETNYMNFVVQNVGENPANIWKKLTNVVNGPGVAVYPVGAAVCSSEPEYEEGGGPGNYVERDNLSAFMVYDMSVCVLNDNKDNCPLIGGHYDNGLIVDNSDEEHAKPAGGGDWTVLVDENNQVRVDNVADTWIKIADGLQAGEELIVSQSYHLMAWNDSGEEMITNWAQGDTMTFDVELEARQLTAPAPGVSEDGTATINLVEKDTSGDVWTIVDGGTSGTLTYNVEGSTFDYDLDVSGLEQNTEYCLIYYADPWAGDNPGAFIEDYNTGTSNVINDPSGQATLATSIPNSADANYPAGGKVWLVLCSDYNNNIRSTGPMTGWNTTEYLFDDGLVNYTKN